MFFVSLLWVSFQSALPVLCPKGDAWAASLPGSTGSAQCRGAAQLTGPLGFQSVSPSYRDCASSLQRSITLTAWIFVLILSVTGGRKWGLTGRPNTEWIYIESSVLWICSLLTSRSRCRTGITADFAPYSRSGHRFYTHVALMNKLFMPHQKGQDTGSKSFCFVGIDPLNCNQQIK